MVIFDERKQEEKIRLLKEREEEALAETLAAHHGIPYLDLSAHPINLDALRVIKEDAAKAAELAVFNATDRKIDVGVLSPKNEKSIAAIEDFRRRGYDPEIFMVSHQSLKKVWDRYKDLSYSFETKSGALDISNDEILEVAKKVHTLDDIKN